MRAEGGLPSDAGDLSLIAAITVEVRTMEKEIPLVTIRNSSIPTALHQIRAGQVLLVKADGIRHRVLADL